MVVNEQNVNEETWSGLLDEVHDRYFDLSQMRFEIMNKKFTLPFGEKRKGPYNERELRIDGAIAVESNDEAHIQFYELLDLRLDRKAKAINIESTGLDIKVELGSGWEINVTEKLTR